MRRSVYVTGIWHPDIAPEARVDAVVVRQIRPEKALYRLTTHTAKDHASLLGCLFREKDRFRGSIIGIYNHEPDPNYIA